MSIGINPLQRSNSIDTTYSLNQNDATFQVKQVQNNPEQKLSSQVGRTLDAYGIDDNRDTLSQLNQDNYNVLIKKNKSGSPILNHGVYVSKKGEDEYGAFKWLNPIGLIKYQTEDVAVVKFHNQDQLDQLSCTYAEKPLPKFLVQILNTEKCRDVEMYQKNPKLAKFISAVDPSQNGYLIRPNSPYISDTMMDVYINNPESLKDSKEGITLCTWAIHPYIQSSFLGEKQNRSDISQIKVDQTTTQQFINDKTGNHSLASILDLKKEHVPQLIKLRDETLQHLADVYKTTENDSVRMFFHFPVAEKTATLHLHTWVNKGDHPLNEPRSFDLDMIIKNLQQGREISELVLSRNNGEFYLPKSDSIKDIPNIPFQGIQPNKLNLPL
ncbi:hypothetical protein [Spartinivicinus ruber]|uniref:hypothetical protein n=1 Tax=Spartinivicinus ruber TaxID=2683272 RepID=UPI0013D3058F|nr:hypothetical protein [Spartinivicinus ruber]